MMAGFSLARITQGAQRWRSIVGLAIVLVLLPFVLGNDSCSVLKTPVGDPEHSRVDPRISGVWLTIEIGSEKLQEYEGMLWQIEPYDARTWLVTIVNFKDAGSVAAPAASNGDSSQAVTSPPSVDNSSLQGAVAAPPQPVDVVRALATLRQERAVPRGLSVFKGWVTTLGGRRFLVLESRMGPSTDRGFLPSEWSVFRAEPGSGKLLLYAIHVGVEKLGEVKDRAQAEAIIARHASDEKFSDYLLFTLYPVPRAAYDAAGAVVERARLLTR
jgi:hypothetical protein